MESGENINNAELKGKRRLVFADVLEHHKVQTTYWSTKHETISAEYLEAAYFAACQVNSCRPLQSVITQLREGSSTLNFKGTRLDLGQVDALEVIFQNRQFDHISVEGCFANQDAAAAMMDILLHYESVASVDFGLNRNLGSRAWISAAQLVKRSTRITTFDAASANIPDAALAPFSRALRSSPFLRVLRLEGCSLSGRPVALLTAGLRQNSSVHELYLAENRLAPEDGAHLRALISLSSTLQLLDLRNNDLQDIGLLHLCEGLKVARCVLETLVLWNNKISTKSINACAEALLANRKLVTLNMGQNAIQDTGAYILKQGLQSNCSIKRLGLVGCRLTDQGIVAIAEFLAESTRLQRLDLRNNDISLGGLMALSLAARENQSVTRIDLDKPPKDNTLPVELIERQNQLWDNLVVYAERNRTRSSALASQLDRNGNEQNTKQKQTKTESGAGDKEKEPEKKEMEFHYAEEPDELHTPKLDLVLDRDETSNNGASAAATETSETGTTAPSQPKPINSPLTPNSAVEAIEVVKSFQEQQQQQQQQSRVL